MNKKKYVQTVLLMTFMVLLTSCGYHLKSSNNLAEYYPQMKVHISGQSLLKRHLVNALLASDVQLVNTNSEQQAAELIISKDLLRKVVQSIGANNQVQEYRLEYDVEYSINGEKKQLHLERDYSFDVQQIAGGQQEEVTLRKQLSNDMAWAIVRQLSLNINE